MTAPRDTEARRQQALLAALATRGAPPADLALRGGERRATQGLDAYRINAAATAHRALGAVFPTVAALIGEEDFEHLAAEFWRAKPPTCGDLGEWGGGFPDWLEAHAAFAEWPYFGDSARLDIAVHRCERAADAEPDLASLARLAEGDPAHLVLVLVPGSALVDSRWPVVAIHAAHHGAGFDAVRAALDRGEGEAAFVARDGWRASVQRLDAATARWTAALLQRAPLGTALEAAGAGFDLAAWLAAAVRGRWVKEVSVIDDEGPSLSSGDPA